MVKRIPSMGLALALSVAVCSMPVSGCRDAQTTPPPASSTSADAVSTAANPLLKPWTGDLDGMVKRRAIRVATTYNKTNYFIDMGVQRGAVYEAFKLFEDELNASLKTGNIRVHVVFVPLSRDELLKAVVDGRADIAAATLTITPERQKLVDFAQANYTNVNEVVVIRSGCATVRVRRGPLGEGSVRPQVEQLLREPDDAELAARVEGQAAGRDQAGARRARDRGRARDGERRPREDHDRRQPSGGVLEEEYCRASSSTTPSRCAPAARSLLRSARTARS